MGWRQSCSSLLQVRRQKGGGKRRSTTAEWLPGIEGPASRASRPIKAPSLDVVVRRAGRPREQSGQPRGWSRSGKRPDRGKASCSKVLQATELAGQLAQAAAGAANGTSCELIGLLDQFGKQGQFRHLPADLGPATVKHRARAAGRLRGQPAGAAASPHIEATASTSGPPNECSSTQRAVPRAAAQHPKAITPGRGAAVHALQPLPFPGIEHVMDQAPPDHQPCRQNRQGQGPGQATQGSRNTP